MLEFMISDKRRLRIAKVADQDSFFKIFADQNLYIIPPVSFLFLYQVVPGFAIYIPVKIHNNLPEQCCSWLVVTGSFRHGQWKP
jgi:hypothetical protein